MSAETAVWHDLEHAGYRADISVWRELIDRYRPASLVELGSGTGRVSLPLADTGIDVTAVDCDAELLAALRARRSPGTRVVTRKARAERLGLDGAAQMVIAPALLIQMMPSEDARLALFASVAQALVPHGVFAASVDFSLPHSQHRIAVTGTERRARNGTGSYRSEVLAVSATDGRFMIDRSRSAPGMAHSEPVESLAAIGPGDLARLAEAVGLEPLDRLAVPPTGRHSSSEVVVFRGP